MIEHLVQLATCLCAQIDTDGSPPVCFCGVLPGEAVAHDYSSQCDEECGMAWVRLVTAGPVSGINILSETVNNCSSMLGVDIEVGIIRCAVINSDGEPPTVAEQLAMTDQQLADMLTMRRAIACCDFDHILGLYTPIGPTGAILGGAWIVSLAEM